MSHFEFKDEGTAFVNALASRKSSFGSLYIVFAHKGAPISRTNLKRLLQLDVSFEKFHMDLLMLDKEFVFLPFSVKTKALSCEISA